MTRTCLFIIVYLIIAYKSSGQKIYWSDITVEDRAEATGVIERLSSYLSKRSYDSISLLLYKDQVNVNGEHWLSHEELLSRFKAFFREARFIQREIVGYTFEDFLESYRESKVIDDIYPVFNNHSILFRLFYEKQAGSQPFYIILRENNSGKWQVFSFCQLPLNLAYTSGHLPDMSEEFIPMAGIRLPLPEDFEIHDKTENQINYYMKGETERDAVLQVMVDEIQAKLHFYTYKFVEYNNQNYDLSDLTVRYLPYGILFEYEVKDSYGTRNKGITVGLEKNDKIVLIQFYSFYDVYKEMEKRVEYIFSNINVN